MAGLAFLAAARAAGLTVRTDGDALVVRGPRSAAPLALALLRRKVCVLAALAWRVDGRHRRIARTNLRIAFPDLPASERDSIARRSFGRCARNLVELGRLERLTPESVRRLVEYDPEAGLDNFLAARARGRSILYLTGHFGAWELLPVAHALYGHPLSFVTRPLDNPWLERYLCRVRQASGNVVRVRSPQAEELRQLLEGPDVIVVAVEPGLLEVQGLSAPLIGEAAAGGGIVLHELIPQQASLEEAFMDLTRDDVEFKTGVEAAA